MEDVQEYTIKGAKKNSYTAIKEFIESLGGTVTPISDQVAEVPIHIPPRWG